MAAFVRRTVVVVRTRRQTRDYNGESAEGDEP
ncbi:MAG: hypothetical protein ACI81R_000996, partial [Bradymonadia bacterium]